MVMVIQVISHHKSQEKEGRSRRKGDMGQGLGTSEDRHWVEQLVHLVLPTLLQLYLRAGNAQAFYCVNLGIRVPLTPKPLTHSQLSSDCGERFSERS